MASRRGRAALGAVVWAAGGVFLSAGLLGSASAQPRVQAAAVAVAPSVFQPAPMPDSGVAAPVGDGDGADPHVDPAFFQQQKTFWGNAYSSGDDASVQQDRRASAAVGAKVSVPMD